MTAWDDLLDTVDRYASLGAEGVPADAEAHLEDLVRQSMADHTIDTELHAPDAARWLVGLALAHQSVRERSPGTDPELDLADLRLILTRWLHPARPR